MRFVGDAYVARIAAREFALDLRFTPTQPLLLQGDGGYSRKGPGAAQASYYYSRAAARRERDDRRMGGTSVDVTGTAWLDHEWSSEMHGGRGRRLGLDRASISPTAARVMAFRMRDKSGGTFWAGGALRGADGRTRARRARSIRFAPLRTWRSPRTGVAYPVAMRVTVDDVELVLEPLFDDQELDSRASTGTIYWEGAVRASAARARSGARLPRAHGLRRAAEVLIAAPGDEASPRADERRVLSRCARPNAATDRTFAFGKEQLTACGQPEILMHRIMTH